MLPLHAAVHTAAMNAVYVLDFSRHWSDYRKHLPGPVLRRRPKIEQNCRLSVDIFSSAIMNDLFTTFTSRPQMDVKCVYQQ